MEPGASPPRICVVRAVGLLFTGMLGLCGCSALGPDADDAEAAAGDFLSAVETQDGETACSMLAPRAVDELESQYDAPCEQAVLMPEITEALAAGPSSDQEPPRSFGRYAQVSSAGQVMFLARDGDRWVVTGAGCTPREDQPYDCAIAGS